MCSGIVGSTSATTEPSPMPRRRNETANASDNRSRSRYDTFQPLAPTHQVASPNRSAAWVATAPSTTPPP